jgi:hypothetical protein
MESGEVLIIEGCTDIFVFDELSSINNRLAMIQQETGETKNTNLFLALSLLGDKRGQGELIRMAGKKQKELDGSEKVQISKVHVRPGKTGGSSEESPGSA